MKFVYFLGAICPLISRLLNQSEGQDQHAARAFSPQYLQFNPAHCPYLSRLVTCWIPLAKRQWLAAGINNYESAAIQFKGIPDIAPDYGL